MKKFFAFLLTFAMLFSLAMPAMAAEDDTATVYFQNNWIWTDVCAYIHYTDGTENAAYPGVTMTFYENDGTYDVYSVTFPVSNIDYIIFSGIKDDGSGARDATPQIPASDLYRNATYYCAWNDGNTYGREGGEGESLDSIAAPSGPSISGNTTGDVTASYTPSGTVEPVVEALWGTSKDDLTDSGTLEQAIAAATTDHSITYIQLQTSVTTDINYHITSGVFTLDLNGKHLSCDTITVNYEGTEVTLIDTGTGGTVSDDGINGSALIVNFGAKVVINGGSYTGWNALMVGVDSKVEINGGSFTGTNGYAILAYKTADDAPDAYSTLTINAGTFSGTRAAVATYGTTTITGGTFTAGSEGHISYYDGTLDLSGYAAGNGLTLSQKTGGDLTVSDENIKLPEGYVFKDGETTVTTLTPQTVYTIAAETAEPTYTITVEEYGKGTVEVPASAAEGDTVTVTITPAEGYTLTDIYGFNAEVDDEIIFEKVNDTTYTFTMLGDNVIVVVEFCLPGTELDTIYYKGPWTNIVFEFSTSGGTPAGHAETTIVESGIYAATSIPEWSYTLYIRNLDDESQYINPGDIPTDGRNMYNAETQQWETYIPSTPPADVTSAEIVWGSMSFTYYDTIDETTGDEKGWSNDGSERAGTVTVTNTGSNAITASATYTPADGYAEITGSLGDDQTLQENESGTFTLTLDGKPDAAISAGTKIGTVTVVITSKTLIEDAAAWTAAIAEGGDITLGANISTGNSKLIDGTTLDLNGHTLTSNATRYEFLNVTGTVVIKDSSNDKTGKVVGASNGTGAVYITANTSADLTIESGTYTGKYALMAYSGTVTINGGTFEGTTASVFSYNRGTTITINGGTFNGAFSGGTEEISGTIIVKGGTFSFDPSAYVDTELYNVTNENGVYTVTAK